MGNIAVGCGATHLNGLQQECKGGHGQFTPKSTSCEKKGPILRALFRTSFAESWMFSQEQLTQESMEGVEAGEGETS